MPKIDIIALPSKHGTGYLPAYAGLVAGRSVTKPGDAAAFKAGDPNGHRLVNKSNAPATFLEVGACTANEQAHYPDIDLAYEGTKNGGRFLCKDGTPY